MLPPEIRARLRREAAAIQVVWKSLKRNDPKAAVRRLDLSQRYEEIGQALRGEPADDPGDLTAPWDANAHLAPQEVSRQELLHAARRSHPLETPRESSRLRRTGHADPRVREANTASLVLAIFGLIFGGPILGVAWVPFIGIVALPSAIVGTLFSTIAIFVALLRGKNGLLLPSIALVVCLSAIAMAFFATFVAQETLEENREQRGWDRFPIESFGAPPRLP